MRGAPPSWSDWASPPRGAQTPPDECSIRTGLMVADGDQGAPAHGGTGEAERSALLRSVFDESPLAILRVTRPGGRLGITVDANPAAARFLGRSPRGRDRRQGGGPAPRDPRCSGRRGAPSLPTRAAAPGRRRGRGSLGGCLGLAAVRRTTRRASPWPWWSCTTSRSSGPRARGWTARRGEDPLTGLINRGELLRQLGALDPQSDGPHVAVIFLDLDGFKMVNDTRGHQAGDELLVAVARRIRAAVRPEDSLARIGGDEFVVLCPRLADPQDVRAVAERVRATLDDPVSVEGRSHRISMSVGISVARADAIDPANLLRQADMAMYRAKDAGRNTVRLHSVEMDEELATAERIREALGVALEVEPATTSGPRRARPALPAHRGHRLGAAGVRRGPGPGAAGRWVPGLSRPSSCRSQPVPGSTVP